MTNLGSLSFLYFAISVNEIYSFSKQKLFGSNLQCITYRQQTVRFGIRLFLLPVTDVTCCNPGPSRQFQLAHVLLLHHTKNSFTDNHDFSSINIPYISVFINLFIRLYGYSIMLQLGKQCSGIYPAHFCLLGKISVPLRSVQSRRPPDVLHPNPLELRINRRAKLTLYHKITFSSLNLPHKDTLLPQVFFSETLFVHYASALFLQYPLRTIFRFHLLSLHTD